MPIDRSERQLQDRLEEVSRLLETHRVLASLTHRQEGPTRDLLEGLQHRQNLAELSKKVRGLRSLLFRFGGAHRRLPLVWTNCRAAASSGRSVSACFHNSRNSA